MNICMGLSQAEIKSPADRTVLGRQTKGKFNGLAIVEEGAGTTEKKRSRSNTSTKSRLWTKVKVIVTMTETRLLRTSRSSYQDEERPTIQYVSL
jgi:hypothetical protein